MVQMHFPIAVYCNIVRCCGKGHKLDTALERFRADDHARVNLLFIPALEVLLEFRNGACDELVSFGYKQYSIFI